MGDIRYEEPELGETERVLGVFYGRANQWGGKLIVTDKRLLFAALDLGALPDILVYVGGKAGVPGTDLGEKVLTQIKGSVTRDIHLVHIATVEPEGKAGWTGAPKVRITTDTEEVIKIDVVEGTKTLIMKGENNEVRDRAVAVIAKAVKAAKEALPAG